MKLELSKITKSYGDKTVVSDVSFTVESGSCFALLGPSGAGKTTILRVVTGFGTPDSGSVRVGGTDITGVVPHRRNIGIVFQNYALFPHLDVYDNVAFGLKMRGIGSREQRRRVDETLALVRLEGVEDRKPAEISGGQQQRVALARALVIQPSLLLLDEPLSALDRKIRQEVRIELKRIQRETGVTTLIVTHDQEEALFLADRMLVVDDGRVQQVGTPWDVYHRPQSRFVAGFMGDTNMYAARLHDTLGNHTIIAEVNDVRFEAPRPSAQDGGGTEITDGSEVWLSIRPEQIRLAEPGSPGTLSATVVETDFTGASTRILLDAEGLPITATVVSPETSLIKRGDRVGVSLSAGGARYFARDETPSNESVSSMQTELKEM